MATSSIKRTTITVPKDLIDSLQQATSSSTKTEAVMTAIHEEIKRRKLARFRALAGKISLDPSILKSRHQDHRLG